MENLGKDILGVIILKLNIKAILNLRITCKKLNLRIISYNKYWFLKYFNIDTFNTLKKNKCITHTFQESYIQENQVVVKITPFVCFTYDEKYDDYDEISSLASVHPNYKKWKKEAESLGYIKESHEKDFIQGYILEQYLKDNMKPKCKHISHYPDFPKFLSFFERPMTNIGIIEEELVPFYKNEENYFKKFLKHALKRHYKSIISRKPYIFFSGTLNESLQWNKKRLNSQIKKLQEDLTSLLDVERKYMYDKYLI